MGQVISYKTYNTSTEVEFLNMSDSTPSTAVSNGMRERYTQGIGKYWTQAVQTCLKILPQNDPVITEENYQKLR
jgi:hypothetical protein